jgi:type II secretory pathway component PulM
MHIMVISLMVAFVVCVLLLGVFWLFTLTPLAHRIQEAERRSTLRPH